VNVAVSLRAAATVLRADRFRVVNRDRDLEVSATRVEDLFEDPLTALAGRLLAEFSPLRPLEVRYRTTAPRGSGLGGSSALGMAIAGALNDVCGAGWSVSELVRIVMDVEVRILRTATGAQDQLAAGLGGAHAHHWKTPAVRSEPLPWPVGQKDPFHDRVALFYTGQAHSSGRGAVPGGAGLPCRACGSGRRAVRRSRVSAAAAGRTASFCVIRVQLALSIKRTDITGLTKSSTSLNVVKRDNLFNPDRSVKVGVIWGTPVMSA